MDEHAKQPPKLHQQLKEMHEVPKHLQISYCDMRSSDHPMRICPPSDKEVNFIGVKQRHGKYDNNDF